MARGLLTKSGSRSCDVTSHQSSALSLLLLSTLRHLQSSPPDCGWGNAPVFHRPPAEPRAQLWATPLVYSGVAAPALLGTLQRPKGSTKQREKLLETRLRPEANKVD